MHTDRVRGNGGEKGTGNNARKKKKTPKSQLVFFCCCCWGSKGWFSLVFFFSFYFSLNSDGNQMLVQFRASSDFLPLPPPYLNDAGRLRFVTGEAPPLEGPCCASSRERHHVRNRQVVSVQREGSLLCMAERWDPFDGRADVWWKREHTARLPFISQVAHSKYWIKWGKVRLAEEK